MRQDTNVTRRTRTTCLRVNIGIRKEKENKKSRKPCKAKEQENRTQGVHGNKAMIQMV